MIAIDSGSIEVRWTLIRNSNFSDRKKYQNWCRDRLKDASGLPDVEILYSPEGKPFLRGSSLAFSLSHSQSWTAFAFVPVSRQREGISLGIDVEDRMRKVDALRIAQRFFHPSEVEVLTQMKGQPEELKDEFFRIWTRKESVVKCQGSALARELSQLPPSDLLLESRRFTDHHWMSAAVRLPIGHQEMGQQLRFRELVYLP